MRYTVRVLFALLILGLFLQSIFSTSFIGAIAGADGSLQDRTLNIADHPLFHLVILFVSVVLLVWLRRGWQRIRQKTEGSFFAKISQSGWLTFLCFFLGAAGCFWILTTQLAPISDQAKVYDIALEWRNRNFSSMAEGGYLFRSPHQTGIVLFYYLLSFLFGRNNYVGIQFLNVAALVLAYFFLAKTAGLCWKDDRKIAVKVYLCLILWLPPFFYVTYLYGILPGAACSFAAVYLAARYLESRKYSFMVAASLCIGAATVFKKNFLICLIAIVCVLIYDMVVTSVKKERIRSLLFIAMMLLAMKGCNLAVERYAERLTGHETAQGEAMMSYVGMGLQDGGIGPGAYSGYTIHLFEIYHYDTEQITEVSFTDAKTILKRYLRNPLEEGIPFFAKKTAFQWNDPTFSGLKLSADRRSAIVLPDFAKSVIEGKIGVGISVFLNYMQTMILFGVLGYLILCRNRKDSYDLFGMILFLGGFLFHMFWEANSTYALPYYIVLVPYAVKGWLDIVQNADAKCKEVVRAGRSVREKGEQSRAAAGKDRKMPEARQVCRIAVVLVVIVLLLLFGRSSLFADTIALDDGAEAKEQFYRRTQTQEAGIETGYYTISPCGADGLVLGQQDRDVVLLQDPETKNITMTVDQKKASIRFRGSEQVLAALPEEAYRLLCYIDDTRNMYYETGMEVKDRWVLEPAGEGEYYLLIGDMALTYEEETNSVYLDACEEDVRQRWVIR
ncbi:MAG: hypothetical protein NC302_09795 [Bacteroidales bacterium]|nr:hypothetical protein [Bacteroidales bacterium]